MDCKSALSGQQLLSIVAKGDKYLAQKKKKNEKNN